TNDSHRIRSRDDDVEIHLAGLDLLREILEADDIRTGGLRGIGVLALREDSDAHGLGRPVRQRRRAAPRLVGLARADAQVAGDVDRLRELRSSELLHEIEGLVGRIDLRGIDLGAGRLLALAELRHGYSPSTSTPMLRALPAIVRTAASMSAAVRSGIFVRAISSTCARVTFPAFVLLGSPLPFSIPAALRRSTAAGGVFVTKVKLRSLYTVITTGTGMPASRLCVEALNALQNSMMVTPCWPSAGPTGGLGFACPAGICSFTYACTFFAISLGLLAGQRCAGSSPFLVARTSYAFSTCTKSSSTGAARPSICTATRSRFLS